MRRVRFGIVIVAVALGTAIVLFLGGGGGAPIEIEIPRLPKGASSFDWGEVPVQSAFHYWLRVRSNEPRKVRLAARIGPGTTEGMDARLEGDTELLPRGSGEVRLVLRTPDRLGPVEGSVTILSEDVPAWSRTYTFRGTVTRKPAEGANVHIEPPGILDLGKMRPGERRPFHFAVESVGTATLTVNDWVVSDFDRVRLVDMKPGSIIVAGADLQVNGFVVAPRAGGEFGASVTIVSDAKNAPRRVVPLRGVVAPPYGAEPVRLDWPSAVRAERPVTEVRLFAEEGQEPFRVAEVLGLDPYFELVEGGSKEPSREQRVRLRLRGDAPYGPARPTLHFRLDPGAYDVEFPVSLEVKPTIVPSLAAVNFVLRPGQPLRPAEVRLQHLLARDFEITGAISAPDFVRVEWSRPAGLAWRIVVYAKADLPGGVHEGTIEIPTSDPETPRVLLRVSVDVR